MAVTVGSREGGDNTGWGIPVMTVAVTKKKREGYCLETVLVALLGHLVAGHQRCCRTS